MKQQPELMSFVEWKERHPVKKRIENPPKETAQRLKQLALRILKEGWQEVTRKFPSKQSMPFPSPKPNNFASVVKRFKELARRGRASASASKVKD